MITLTGSKPDTTYLTSGDIRAKSVMSFVGLSTDTKPTGTYEGTYVGNGSTFFEMNTSTVFMYDEANTTWHELG